VGEDASEHPSEHPSAPSSPDRDVKPIIHASPPVTPSMQQMIQHQVMQQQQLMMMNGGTPKTPAPSQSPASGLNSPSNGPMIPMSTPILSADGFKTSPFRFDERGPFRFDNERISLGESLIPKSDPMEARLQEMLRFNMDQYANQNLDTLHISRRVRELLSVHNIGQRLFAKYVLGLSQGTVSELLSKPKPWDKLTEKGRDSYRKMHGWACDEHAVMLLKSLIPKKGKKKNRSDFIVKYYLLFLSLE
jgi:homeobox protein cut-like